MGDAPVGDENATSLALERWNKFENASPRLIFVVERYSVVMNLDITATLRKWDGATRRGGDRDSYSNNTTPLFFLRSSKATCIYVENDIATVDASVGYYIEVEQEFRGASQISNQRSARRPVDK